MSAFTGPSLIVEWSQALDVVSYDYEIHDTATYFLRRSGNVGSTTKLEYRYQDAVADGGPWRDVKVRVRSRDSAGITADWQEVQCINPQCAALAGIALAQISAGIRVTWSPALEPDLAYYKVWVSDTTGFTPSDLNLRYRGNSTSASVQGLNPGQTYYVRVAAFDVWGEDGATLSAESSLTAGAVVAGSVAADSVDTAAIQNGAVTNAKLAGLSVATGNIQDAAVTNTKLGALSVATGNVQDGAITNAKLSALAVATGNLQNGSVTSAKISVTALSDIVAALGTITGGTLGEGANLTIGTTTGSQIGTSPSQKIGIWGAIPIVQPASADQAAVTLVNANGAIGGLPIGLVYSQSEIQALRDACETLADDVRALSTLLHAIRASLADGGFIKGSA